MLVNPLMQQPDQFPLAAHELLEGSTRSFRRERRRIVTRHRQVHARSHLRGQGTKPSGQLAVFIHEIDISIVLRSRAFVAYIDGAKVNIEILGNRRENIGDQIGERRMMCEPLPAGARHIVTS